MRWFVAVLFLCLAINIYASDRCDIGLDHQYEVESKSYRETSFVADFIYPKKCSKFKRIIITFGGSEGGVNTRFARRLASNGFAVYALGYFSVQGSSLPKYLVKVPLEYFQGAIKKIKEKHPTETCCSLVGGSKGAEAILTLLSRTNVNSDRVILISGSDRVMEGLGKQNRPSQSSSWSYKGEGIPYTPLDNLTLVEFIKLAWSLFKKPIELKNMYLRSISNKDSGKNGVIAVEDIKSDILFLSGEDDHLWPSSLMGRNLEKLFKNNEKQSFKHISYKGVGHAVLSGHLVLTNEDNQTFLGGNIKDSEKADKDAYSRIVNFLKNDPYESPVSVVESYLHNSNLNRIEEAEKLLSRAVYASGRLKFDDYKIKKKEVYFSRGTILVTLHFKPYSKGEIADLEFQVETVNNRWHIKDIQNLNFNEDEAKRMKELDEISKKLRMKKIIDSSTQ